MSISASKTCAAKSAAKLDTFFEPCNRFGRIFRFLFQNEGKMEAIRSRMGDKGIVLKEREFDENKVLMLNASSL